MAKAVSLAARDDDGDASITSHGLVLGTPAYMAPEQAVADPAMDHRLDLYALGVVAYEMLAGRHPFADLTARGMVAAHASHMPEPPSSLRADIPAALDALVMHCLAKDPAARPSSAEDVLVRLEALTPARLSAGLARVREQRRPWLLAAIVLTLLGVGAALLLRSGAPARAPVAATSVARLPSIAVLPFENTGGRAEDVYLSDGLSDELIGALGRVEGLRTAARSASFVFRDQQLSPAEIGRRLHVGAVLQGVVRRDGNRLRVMVQLVDTTGEGFAIWSENFEREMQDVFAVQDEIATAIVNTLRVRLTSRAPLAYQTRRIDAYDLYLRGRYHYNKFTEEDLRRGLAYFEQALAIDSGYAPAWAMIAESYISLADDWLPPRRAYPRAKAAALRALALDSTLASAHASLGTIAMSYDWDFAAAEREFRIARSLRPNDPWAYNQIATLLLRSSDRGEEALNEIERARLLDSLDVTYQAGLAAALLWLRRYDDAIRAGERALAMEEKAGIHILIGDAQLARGQPAAALRSFERARALGYVRAPEAIARADAALGRRAEARQIAEQLERRVGNQYVRAEYIARVWAALGERDSAFAWLDTAYAQRSAGMTWLAVHPAYAPLRDDPRYRTLLERVGLRPQR